MGALLSTIWRPFGDERILHIHLSLPCHIVPQRPQVCRGARDPHCVHLAIHGSRGPRVNRVRSDGCQSGCGQVHRDPSAIGPFPFRCLGIKMRGSPRMPQKVIYTIEGFCSFVRHIGVLSHSSLCCSFLSSIRNTASKAARQHANSRGQGAAEDRPGCRLELACFQSARQQTTERPSNPKPTVPRIAAASSPTPGRTPDEMAAWRAWRHRHHANAPTFAQHAAPNATQWPTGCEIEPSAAERQWLTLH